MLNGNSRTLIKVVIDRNVDVKYICEELLRSGYVQRVITLEHVTRYYLGQTGIKQEPENSFIEIETSPNQVDLVKALLSHLIGNSAFCFMLYKIS